MQALFIPKKARIRIVALGAYRRQQTDSLKQRGGVRRGSKLGTNVPIKDGKQRHNSLSLVLSDDVSVLTAGHGNGSQSGVTVGETSAINSSTASETKRSKYKQKLKGGDDQSGIQKKQAPQPRKHSAEIQAKIDKIRQ